MQTSTNKDVLIKCKMCGKEAPAAMMRLDKNGRDMLCSACNERQRTRESIMKNVKIG